MTTLRIVLAVALLGFLNSAGALRVLEQVERPVELSPSVLTLPKDTSGTVSFKPCDTCQTSTHRLMNTTKFVLDGRELPFNDFAKAFGELRANRSASDRAVATVYMDVNTGQITRIALHRPQ